MRGDSSCSAVLRSVVKLKEAVKSRFGVMPASTTDWAPDGGSAEAASCEVLIGMTNRPESTAAQKELEGRYGYIIRSVGDTLVITASTATMLDRAVDRFISDYLQKAKSKYMPSNIDVFYVETAPVSLLCEDGRTLNVALPEKSSSLLRGQVECFAEALGERGVDVVVSGEHCEKGMLLIGYEGEMPDETPDIASENESDTYYGKRCVVVTAESDALLAAALAGLYEYLSNAADETLIGEPLIGCSKTMYLKDSWSFTTPRIVGGVFLHAESFSVSGTRIYFEGVSDSEYQRYVKYLTEEFGLLRGSPSSAETLNFVTRDDLRISLTYDRLTGELAAVESP